MTTQWIPHPTVLAGNLVDLIPLQPEHLEELYAAAADKTLWELIPTDCSDKNNFDRAYIAAMEEREKGREYPFVVFHKASQKLIGSTRLFEIFPQHRKVEIGWTWITRPYWGTAVNPECKLLLLRFCFNVLHTVRVQLKTKDSNLRSRRAIEKIGASFEGIFRKDKIQEDGSTRNAAYYSIIDEEWPEAEQKIIALLS